VITPGLASQTAGTAVAPTSAVQGNP
jgi:hypothetical protein